jgi:hypothetical protein
MGIVSRIVSIKGRYILWRIGALGLGCISVRCFFQWNYVENLLDLLGG